MVQSTKSRSLRARATALSILLAISSAPVAACSRKEPPPPVDDTRSGQVAVPRYGAARPAENLPSEDTNRNSDERPGLSTKKKVVMLAGAAALYYLYKKHQNAKSETGADGQYYLSKNGRVYYRDAEHRAHWVTPPSEGIAVPEDEAAQYQQFQGYDGRSTGRDLSDLAEAR